MLLIISDDYSRKPQLDWSPEPPQEDPGSVCGERLPPRSRHARDALGRHLPPLHHPGPLPLHGVAAPGLQVYVHHCGVLLTLPDD